MKLPVVEGITAAEFWARRVDVPEAAEVRGYRHAAQLGGARRLRARLLLLRQGLVGPRTGRPAVAAATLPAGAPRPGFLAQALVPTPGGAGGGEWGFGALYLLFRTSEANGVLASLVRRMLDWVFGLASYAIYLWMRPRLPVESGEEADS